MKDNIIDEMVERAGTVCTPPVKVLDVAGHSTSRGGKRILFDRKRWRVIAENEEWFVLEDQKKSVSSVPALTSRCERCRKQPGRHAWVNYGGIWWLCYECWHEVKAEWVRGGEK